VDGYRLPPVSLTQAEANALITVEHLMQTHQDTALVHEYNEAMTKLRAVLRTSAREKANFLDSRLKVYASADI